MLLEWTIAVNVSILAIKMERPLKDQKENISYWYCSQWRDIGSKAKNSKKEAKGDKNFSVGK
jgi:hypothetical protein